MNKLSAWLTAGGILLFTGIGGGLWYQYSQAPELECVGEVTVEYGEPVSVYALVRRVKGTGSVTLSIAEAEEGEKTEISFPQTGRYTLTVVAAGESGFTSSAQVAVTVEDSTPPVLTAEAFSVHLGEDVDYLAAVTAVDELDGDLMGQVTVDSSEVDLEKTGAYVVYYQVADQAGNQATAKACLTVLPKEAEGVSLSQERCCLSGNGHIQLTATVLPEDWAGDLIWSSSDEKVAIVSGGLVTWQGQGTATITVRAGTLTASCAVTCEALKPSALRLNRHTLTLSSGGTAELTATVLPSNYTGKVTWSSSNEKVARVENGTVIWAGKGSCVIVATVDGCKDQCAVTCGKKSTGLDWLFGMIFG